MKASSRSEPEILAARLAALSPDRRAVVERLLGARGTISRRPEGEWTMLSFGQQRLWFMAQLDPDSPVYNTVTIGSLPDPLDLEALQWSVDGMVQRHEILRSTFAAVDGEPLARLSNDLKVVVEIDPELSELARRPFELERGPLVRVGALTQRKLLVASLHHIITDAWSMRIFFRELWTLYQDRRQNNPTKLPALPISYADYAAWQRQELAGLRLEKLLTFWRTELADLPVLDLVTDQPRPAIPGFRGGSVPVRIPTEVTAGLRALAREEEATLFMAVLAAFSLLLSRYSGQECVAVGSPITGRTRSELEGLIGFFVNTIVLRCDLHGEPSFRQLIVRTRETAIRAYAHQDLPFEKLVEDLQPARDLSRNPIHQVMFQLEKTEFRASSSVPALVEKETSLFDLSLDLWDGPEGLSGNMEYSKELFERNTVEELVARFEILLGGLIANPDIPANRVPLMSLHEEEQLQVFSPRLLPVPAPCIHEAISAQAIRTPDAMAVGTLSYRELLEASDQVAQYLISRGAGADGLVGVSMSRGPALVKVLLGILKAGAAYLPLDPDDPPARRQQIIGDATPLLILTDADSFSSSRSSSRMPPVNPTSLAYAIYTSGSTGAPKGVLVEHHSLTNHCLAFAKAAHLSPSDRVLQFASPIFDVAAEEIFPTLMTGGTVIPRLSHRVPSLTEFHSQIEREQITVVNLPSGYWHEWVEAMANGSIALPTTLRLVIVGSERVEPTSVASWHRLVGERAKLFHAYGVSEATITSFLDPLENETILLKRPLDHIGAMVADQHGEPVPNGMPGELWLSGEGVARGYLGRPELTAERFVERKGQRFYRSGDRVRRRANGALELLGRLDEQIKVGGLRIEPAEIESQLALHPQVKRAAVTLRNGQLVAYVMGSAAPDLLREYLGARLPATLVPGQIESIDAFPQTPNGKIDKRALPAPKTTWSRGRKPVGILESQIASVWQEVLGLTKVSVHDNFFDLGGRSLLLVRVQAILAKRLNREISILTLFRWPTIQALAAHLSGEIS